MKNTIITIIVLIFTTISCKAQIILVENFEEYNQELPDGAYVKDANNVLGKFVGTWKGTYDNKNYEFKVTKHTENNINLKYKEDLLLIRYKITDTNGAILVNTLNLPNDNKYVINGTYLVAKTNSYVLSYLGKNGECGQNGDVFISVYGTNNTKMQLFLSVNGEIYSDCTTGPAKQILPTKGGMSLTKQ